MCIALIVEMENVKIDNMQYARFLFKTENGDPPQAQSLAMKSGRKGLLNGFALGLFRNIRWWIEYKEILIFSWLRKYVIRPHNWKVISSLVGVN